MHVIVRRQKHLIVLIEALSGQCILLIEENNILL